MKAEFLTEYLLMTASCLALHECVLESVPPLVQRAAETLPAVIHLLQPSLQVSRLLAVRLQELSAAEVNGQHDGLALIQSLLQLLRRVTGQQRNASMPQYNNTQAGQPTNNNTKKPLTITNNNSGSKVYHGISVILVLLLLQYFLKL